MVEIGFTGLTELFLRLVKDGLGRLLDPEALITSGAFVDMKIRSTHN